MLPNIYAGSHKNANFTQPQSELEARRVEVDQLTSLSLRGDATVQEYMANCKVDAKPPTANHRPQTAMSAVTLYFEVLSVGLWFEPFCWLKIWMHIVKRFLHGCHVGYVS